MNSSRRVMRTAVWMSISALILTLTACGGGSSAETFPSSTPSSTEQQAPTLTASDYFAANTIAGDHLVYINAENSASAWNAHVETVASLQTTASALNWVFNDMQADGTYGSQHYVLADQSGLWSSNTPIDPTTHAGARKLLPAEFKIGDMFVLPDSTTNTNATDDSGIPYTVTQHNHTEVKILGTEDITTLAGEFKNCLKTVAATTVTMTSVKNGVPSSNTSPVTLTTWYAPGIGKVREIYDDVFSSTMDLSAYQIAGIGNEQIRPTATIGTTLRTGQVVDTSIFAIQFSEPMLLTTVNSASIQVIDPNGQQVPITISTSTLTTSLTVDADASYTPVSGTYQIKLSDKIKDLAGNGLVPLEQSLDVTISQACCNWSGATVYLWAH